MKECSFKPNLRRNNSYTMVNLNKFYDQKPLH
jgi:hypothetical protein